VENKKWLRLIVSGLSLVLSLALDLYYPHVKDALCTAMPGSSINPDSFDTIDQTELNRDRMERIK
jgi:hypothetical protein